MSQHKDQPEYEKAHENAYDRQLGMCQGMLGTKVSTVTLMNPLAIGGARLYTVQTFRAHDRDEEGRIRKSYDTVFIQFVAGGETIQMVLPAKVADTIARQRDALSAKTRSSSAKEKAERNKAAGIVPFAGKVAR